MALAANSKSAYVPLAQIYGNKGADGQYSLSALDMKNLNDNLWSIVKKIQGNLTLSDLTSLAVDELRAGTVISNTTITNNLYAAYGDIAELTVDRLLTVDKISRYQERNASDVNYVWIQDQCFKLMTGTTDGATIQHTNRSGQPLYWTDANMTATGTTVTAYPVIVYQYTEQCKAEFSFVMDSSTGFYTPKIVLGAGDGVKPNSAKAIIYKGQTGLDISYYASNTEERRRILLGDEGITVTPAFLIFPDAYNASVVTATAATVLQGIGVTFRDTTRVAFDVQIDVTTDQAMSLLVEARVGGTAQRHCTKYFAGAYKDTICFNGVFDSTVAGTKTVDIVITPSVGTATIAAQDYRLMLTIRDGSSAEAAPWPEINVTDYIKVRRLILDDVVSVVAQAEGFKDYTETLSVQPFALSDTVTITLT